MADSETRKFPTWLQSLVLLAAGVVVGISGCFGLITSGLSRGENALTAAWAVVFGAGILAFLVGIVLFFWRLVIHLSGRSGSAAPPAPPPTIAP
jgi:hypothetical protein